MIDPDQLDEILDVLRDKGVSSFACPEFSVVLGAAPAGDDDDISDAIAEANRAANLPHAATGLLGHPALWGGRGPSRFPGSERSTPTHVPTHADDEE